ncbi:MAG: hypothetical protein K940chlam6_00845 [Chlamydiae bacterium]|nr:hypothetical protein [Chlamydiota bacterium]
MVEAAQKIREVPNIQPVLGKNDSPFLQDGSTSSIAPAGTKELYTSSKPILDNPIQRTIEYFANHLEPIVDRWSRFKETTIESKFKEIEDLHRQEAIKLAEAHEASKEVTFWGILEDIGSSIMSAVSFFFGFSALSAGATAVGGALIISGVLSLGNLAFKHAHVWDWIADQVGGKNEDLKVAIKTYVPAAIGVTAAAMGIYGSYAAWSYAAQTGIKQATSLLQSTTTIATAMSAYGSGMSQYTLKNATADLSFLQSNSEFSTLSLEESVEDLKKFHENQTQLHTNIGKILEETDQAIQVIQQPV